MTNNNVQHQEVHGVDLDLFCELYILSLNCETETFLGVKHYFPQVQRARAMLPRALDF